MTTRISMATFLSVALFGCNPQPPNTDLCKSRKAGDLVLTELMLDPDGADTGQEWVELFNATPQAISLKGVQVYTKKLDGTGLKAHGILAGEVPSRGYFTLGDVRQGPNPAWINYSYADGLGGLAQTEGIVGLRCGTTTLDEVTYTKAAKASRSRMLGGTSDPDATANDDEAKWCDTDPAKTYSGVNAGTPGAPNGECTASAQAGTCLENGTARAVVHPAAGDVIITEVMADPKAVADTAGEWVEVKAISSVDLNGLVLSAGSSKTTLAATSCLHLNAGDYGVLARSSDPATNGGLPAPLATITVSLANSGGPVTLSLPDAGVDTATLPAALSGVAWQLSPTTLDALANDDPASFCPATARFGADGGGDFGTPGAANTTCPLAPDPNSCIDAASGRVRPIARPVAGDLAITEFMANPGAVSDTFGEWFEVVANQPVDLNGLVLGNEGTSTTTVSSQACLFLDRGSYAVFARSADAGANGGLPPPMATFGFALANSGSRFISISSQGAELDRFSYTTAATGASTQLASGLTAPTDNEVTTNVCPTPAGTTYGGGLALADGGVTAGDRGTPGAANVACP